MAYRFQLGGTRALELLRTIPCRRSDRAAQRDALLLQPMVEVGCARDMKTGHQVATVDGERLLKAAARKMSAHLEYVAPDRVGVQPDPALTARLNRVVSQRQRNDLPGGVSWSFSNSLSSFRAK